MLFNTATLNVMPKLRFSARIGNSLNVSWLIDCSNDKSNLFLGSDNRAIAELVDGVATDLALGAANIKVPNDMFSVVNLTARIDKYNEYRAHVKNGAESLPKVSIAICVESKSLAFGVYGNAHIAVGNKNGTIIYDNASQDSSTWECEVESDMKVLLMSDAFFSSHKNYDAGGWPSLFTDITTGGLVAVYNRSKLYQQAIDSNYTALYMNSLL